MISHYDVQQIQKRGTGSKVPRFFVLIFMMFVAGILPACATKQSKSLINHDSIHTCSLVTRQNEARMVDMPLPVGGVLVPAVNKIGDTVSKSVAHTKTTCNGSVLTYRVTATREALLGFYEDEMMRLGWNKLAQSSGDEELLVFESPSKVAIIQMRPEKPKKGWKRNKKIMLTLHETFKENLVD